LKGKIENKELRFGISKDTKEAKFKSSPVSSK